MSRSIYQRINEASPESAVVVPMDGFHFPKTTLRDFPDPAEAFKRRGAPFTFDKESLLALIKKIKADGEAQAPGWDHSVGDPIEHAITISKRSVFTLSSPENIYTNFAMIKLFTMINQSIKMIIFKSQAMSNLFFFFLFF